eukprot:scaffold18209_cov88-Skeletonema_dohrnii-CCMP3373.AAC.5
MTKEATKDNTQAKTTCCKCVQVTSCSSMQLALILIADCDIICTTIAFSVDLVLITTSRARASEPLTQLTP